MTSSFSGLSSALSALHAQRRGLDTTGQNIANANTEGYTRQRVDMQARVGSPVAAIFSTWNGAGAGVEVSGVSRLRDAFLESRGRAEHAQQTYLSAREQVYGRIENIFAEPSDTALQSQLSDFWAGWHDVANLPGDPAGRAQLIQRGAVVADGLREAYDALGSQWTTIRVQAEAYTTDVNAAADAVAQLNQTILQTQAAGMPVNELSDRRDKHLMELAELVGATASVREDGTVNVFVGGSALVVGGSARKLEVVGAQRLEDQAGDKVVMRWADIQQDAAVGGGELAASLDTLGDLIPGYAGKLDDIAGKLASTVNTQHLLGFGTDGVGNRPFFSGTTAATIAVAITSPGELAVASVAGTLDGENAAKLGEMGKLTTGADAAYQQMVVGLGVEAQTAQRRSAIQAAVAGDMDALRAADAGVNLDEEMTNMITYQRAYEAASRVMTTVDSMLDTLINRTGLVGR
jgi:flagellar hook-associated protein 1